MNIRFSVLIISSLLIITNGTCLDAQNKVWSIDDCIQYALEKNIQVKQAQVSSDINGIDLNYAKSAWYPSLSGSARENFSWSNQVNNATRLYCF